MARFSRVFWDVDDTLLDFSYSQRNSLIKCFQSAGMEATEEQIQRYKEINDDYWRRLELGEVTKAQLLTGRFTSLFEEFDIRDVDVESFLREYQVNLGTIFRYKEDAFQVCESLQGKVKQYVITNGVAFTQRSKLKLSGLDQFMEDLFISEDAGINKPQRGFFDYCLKKISENEGEAEKESILIVGDSLTSDIKGGTLAGISVCWYRPEDIFLTNPNLQRIYEEYRPDYEISGLRQIFGVLGI